MPAKKTVSQRDTQSDTLKDAETSVSFEHTLQALEQIVTQLESGDLPLEEALSAFENGIQLARVGQQRLQQAEQRVQMLLSDDADAALSPFSPDSANQNNQPL